MSWNQVPTDCKDIHDVISESRDTCCTTYVCGLKMDERTIDSQIVNGDKSPVKTYRRP